MNQFTAKKLGEVLAFAIVGLDSVERGRAALEEVLGPELTASIAKQSGETAAAIKNLAAGYKDSQKVILEKAEKTAEKLRVMRDLYVGEQWDNGVELLEWSSFFQGAAAIHWHVVRGATKTLGNKILENLCAGNIIFHENLLKTIGEKIESIAAAKAAK